MVQRSVKMFLEVVGALVAGLLIITGFGVWRFSQGPISLEFLTPYIEGALSAPDGSVKVKLDRTVLAWAGWNRTLDLRAEGVHATDAAGQALATFPEISVRLSVRALLRGVVAPTSLEVIGARLRLRRDASGKFDVQLSDEQGAAAQTDILPVIVQDLLQPRDPDRPLSYLRQLRITAANLIVDDKHWDTSWRAQLNYLILSRDRTGIRAEANLAIAVGGDVSKFRASGLYDASAKVFDLDLAFDGLKPALFAQAMPDLAPLARVSLPLEGSVRAKVELTGAVDGLRFDIRGGEGKLAVGDLLPEDLPVKSLEIRAALDDGGRRLTLGRAVLDLGGATFELSGGINGIGGDDQLILDVVGRDIKVDDLARRWPETLAVNARRWVTTNLSRGTVDELRTSVSAHGQGYDFSSVVLDKLAGSMALSGVEVRYLGKMPSVVDVAGNIRFDEKNFHISVNKGTVEGLSVDEGTADITGLDVKDQFIAIDLVLKGPLGDALRLIDHEPLGYASALGFKPDGVSGLTAVRLGLKFPLNHDLRFSQVQVAAAANMKDVGIAKIFLGQNLEKGDLSLQINKAGMEVSGKAALGQEPISIDWNERFGKQPDRRIRIAGNLDDATRKSLGLDTDGMIVGLVPVNLNWHTIDRQSSEIDLALDLTKSAMALPQLGWKKAEGVAGKANLSLLLVDEKLRAVRAFDIAAGDLTARGKVSFDPASGAFRAVNFERLVFGRNDLVGSVDRGADGTYDVKLDGGGLDISPFLKTKPEKSGAGVAETKPASPKKRGPKLAVEFKVDKLWLAEKATQSLNGVDGKLNYDGDHPTFAMMTSKTQSGAEARLQIEPSDTGRAISLNTGNAGDFLRALDVTDNVVGGKLKLSAKSDDTAPEMPINGTLRIDNYQLLKAPFLARLLTLASLTGIVDQLSGQGISFSSLLASFTKTGGKVEVQDGRTAGSALGFTFEGSLDFDANTIKLNGTIVPVYTLNSLLGNIPILGQILVGPKGGGVFAATYQATGDLDSPDISVNPLTALAPGILRGFLDIFSGGGGSGTSGPIPDRTQSPENMQR